MSQVNYVNLSKLSNLVRRRKNEEDSNAELKNNWFDINSNPAYHTSRVIYEGYRKRRLEGRVRSFLIFCLSTILSSCAVVIMGVLQYDDYFAFINNRNDYIKQFDEFCSYSTLGNVDLISTPLAGILIFLYTIIYKRRIFLRDKFRYRNIGLPMIVSCWKKKQRFYTALTYGLIAYNVFNIVRSFLVKNNNQIVVPFKDPTGLIKLMIKIFEVLMIGIRYYPVLVAYRNNILLINMTSCLYMYVDFVENLLQFGKCQGISSELDAQTAETERRLPFFISYKVLGAIPLSIFLSFIVVNLTYRTIINIGDLIYRSDLIKSQLRHKSDDSFCCHVCNVEDDDEVIFAESDINYVLDLLNGKPYKSILNASKSNDEIDLPALKEKYPCTEIKNRRPKLFQLLTKVYPWHEHFRFSSKFINSVCVGVVALYYFFLFWGYLVIVNVTRLTNNIPTNFTTPKINIGQFLCSVNEDFCIDMLQAFEFPLPLPQKIANFIPNLQGSLVSLAIIPIFGSFFFCLVQIFFMVKESKKHLMELYRGQCEFVVKAKNIPNPKIASYSFHFGGYLVGYLIWGYFIFYVFVVVIGLVIIGVRLFVGDEIFGQVLLKLVPVIVVVIVKVSFNQIASRIIFLNRKSTVLAIDNFRAFNIFLYFNFFFDCFMGLVSAVIRLVMAIVISILMMPRISYSFLGRHFEHLDNAYASYTGFLHMESLHTNSILITFCSILYYKNLDKHIKRHLREKKLLESEIDQNEDLVIEPKMFTGLLEPESETSEIKRPFTKNYNKAVVNKWRLMLMLNKNKELIRMRSANLEQKEKPIGFFVKLIAVVVKLFNKIRGKKEEKESHQEIEN